MCGFKILCLYFYYFRNQLISFFLSGYNPPAASFSSFSSSSSSSSSRYSDYVLKNAFYELDMPIQCELFNQKLDVLVNGK